jgi:hypothetical protein
MVIEKDHGDLFGYVGMQRSHKFDFLLPFPFSLRLGSNVSLANSPTVGMPVLLHGTDMPLAHLAAAVGPIGAGLRALPALS